MSSKMALFMTLNDKTKIFFLIFSTEPHLPVQTFRRTHLPSP